MEKCDCTAYHVAYAFETLKRNKPLGRYALVATHCNKCGQSYWSFCHPYEHNVFNDMFEATKIKTCSESELRTIVDDMIQRAKMTGITADKIDISIKNYGNQSNCFVATVVYGSPFEPQVVILKNWREEKLKKIFIGRLFIQIYNFIGPIMAMLVNKRVIPVKPIKKGLDILVKIISKK